MLSKDGANAQIKKAYHSGMSDAGCAVPLLMHNPPFGVEPFAEDIFYAQLKDVLCFGEGGGREGGERAGESREGFVSDIFHVPVYTFIYLYIPSKASKYVYIP